MSQNNKEWIEVSEKLEMGDKVEVTIRGIVTKAYGALDEVRVTFMGSEEEEDVCVPTKMVRKIEHIEAMEAEQVDTVNMEAE